MDRCCYGYPWRMCKNGAALGVTPQSSRQVIAHNSGPSIKAGQQASHARLCTKSFFSQTSWGRPSSRCAQQRKKRDLIAPWSLKRFPCDGTLLHIQGVNFFSSSSGRDPSFINISFRYCRDRDRISLPPVVVRGPSVFFFKSCVASSWPLSFFCENQFRTLLLFTTMRIVVCDVICEIPGGW